MSYFHATIIASALTASLASSAVYANESCNVDLSAAFTINPSSIEFLTEGETNAEQSQTKQKLSLYKIIDGQKLFIAKQSVKLTPEQQALLKKYDEKIRELVPQVKSVAIEGIDLAVEGVNLAFNGLLGEGNKVGAELTQELELIRVQVAANLSIENGISVGTEGLASEELLGKDFEQRIKSAVAKAVLNSMGTIMLTIGQQMLTADSDGQSFETRMENFSETIEQEITVRSAQIEKKAQALCLNVAKLDALEEQLKAEIKPLANIKVFTVTQVPSDDKQASSM